MQKTETSLFVHSRQLSIREKNGKNAEISLQSVYISKKM